MSNEFVTGITGFIGSSISASLLREGNGIIGLARAKDGKSAKERAVEAINYADPDIYRESGNMRIVEGDMTKDRLGISEDDILEMIDQIDTVNHVAGSISFDEKSAEETRLINIRGTENALQFASIVQARRFIYLGTAYVRPHRKEAKSVSFEDELFCRDLVNEYEKSKCQGEQTVRLWALDNPDIQVVILRPSIVVGDSVNGITSNFSGFYQFNKSLYIFGKYIRAKKPEYVVDGIVNLPVRVPGWEKAQANIITIDYLVKLFMKLRKRARSGLHTYHITNQESVSYEWMLQEVLKNLGIKGPSSRKDMSEPKDEYLKGVQKHLIYGMRDYIPYVSEDVNFDQKNLRETLGDDFELHPKITPQVVKTLMDFALTYEFDAGKRRTTLVG